MENHAAIIRRLGGIRRLAQAGLNLKSRRTKHEVDRLLRDGRVENHLHRIIVTGLYLVSGSAALMFVMLVYHYISPYPILTPEQLTDLKQLLFSGAVGAGVSELEKKYLGRERKDH